MITISKTPNTSNTRDYTVANTETNAQARVILTSPDAALPNAWLTATPSQQWTRYKYRRYPSKHDALVAAILFVDPSEQPSE